MRHENRLEVGAVSPWVIFGVVVAIVGIIVGIAVATWIANINATSGRYKDERDDARGERDDAHVAGTSLAETVVAYQTK